MVGIVRAGRQPLVSQYRRRIATNAAGRAEVTVPVTVVVDAVTAAWPAGAGAVTVAVDGRPVATMPATTTSPAVIRLDRPEVVDGGRTITVTLPAAGTVQLHAEVCP